MFSVRSSGDSGSKAVVIAYDSRNMSLEFATQAALCLAANGIKAYIFESLRSTPELSFAVRKLGCIAGVNITASHNPPEYNGYKVYWEDGAQITPPHDQGIMDEVSKIQDYRSVKTMSQEEAQKASLYQMVGQEMDDAYIQTLKGLVLHQDAIDKAGKDITIVYSPLHGAGNVPVRRILKELGFDKVYVVPEQERPDGNFPTVSYPNPESEEVFRLGLKLANEVDADVVLATDPDADRLDVYVKDEQSGSYRFLTGNMSGCLLADYQIGQRKALMGLPEDGYLIKTIVTSNLADAIAKGHGVGLLEVLTGFKYIGQRILEFEATGKGQYLFGLEESYGCLIGTYARDKDAVSASMALCEAAAYYKTKDKTLWDAMMDIYDTYGYYKDDVVAITLEGIEGLQKIQTILGALRENVPVRIGEYQVMAYRDYQTGIIKDVRTGEESATGLPISDVLYYELSDDAWFCVRPSGTEPKVKFYYGVRGDSLKQAEQRAKSLGEQVLNTINSLISA